MTIDCNVKAGGGRPSEDAMGTGSEVNASRRTTRNWKGTARVVAIVGFVGLGLAEDAALAQRNRPRQTAVEAELESLIAQLKALTPRESAQRRAQLPRGCAPFAGRMIAPNVREAIPVNPQCRTREERVYMNRVNDQIVLGMQVGSQRHVCEMRRASQPYGSFRRAGRMNPGWYDTAVGPMRTACP